MKILITKLKFEDIFFGNRSNRTTINQQMTPEKQGSLLVTLTT